MPEFEYNGEPDDQVDSGTQFEEETEVDPFEKYLNDEPDDETDDDKKAKAEEARLQALVDGKLAQRLGEKQQQQEREPVRDEPRQQQQQQQQPQESMDQTLDKMAKELTEDFAENPEKALKKMLSLNARLASDTQAQANARANRSSADFYLAQRESSDPEFKEYGDSIRKLIDSVPPNIMAQYTPEGLKAALDKETDAAYGRMMREKATKARGQKSSAVPNYGGGGDTGSRRPGASVKLSAQERQLIAMGESAKLSPADIRELLKENRKGRN